MTLVDDRPSESEPSGVRPRSAGIIDWLTTTDHKQIGLLYMAASALNFEAARNQVHQVLAVRADGGRSDMPLRPVYDLESRPVVR